jgi:hypothetical protein
VSFGGILTACRRGLNFAREYGIFRGRASSETSEAEKVACCDLVNLIGECLPLHPRFIQQTKANGFLQEPWRFWPRKTMGNPFAVPLNDDYMNRNVMASLLRYRPSMNGGYTLTIAQTGGEWNHRWSIEGIPDPQANPRGFLRAMTDMVILHEVRDWRTRFSLYDTPRPVPFDLNAAEWEIQLEQQQRSVQARPVVRAVSWAAPSPANPFNSVPVPRPASSRSTQSLLSVVVPAPRPASSSSTQSLLPVIRTVLPTGVNVPAVSSSAQSSASTINPGDVRHPRWARVFMPESLRVLLTRLRRTVQVNVASRTPITLEDRLACLEYVYQHEFHDPKPSHEPTSERYWIRAVEYDKVLNRKPGSLHNHWKKVARALYPAYRDERNSSNPRRLGPSDSFSTQRSEVNSAS